VVTRLPQISVIQIITKLIQLAHLNSLYHRDKTATGKKSAGKVVLSIKYIYWVFSFFLFRFINPFRVIPDSLGTINEIRPLCKKMQVILARSVSI
jgi:hypothetical protein